MHTCIVVPAFAGSCPAQLSANGSAVPATVDVVTMAKSESEMAAAAVTDDPAAVSAAALRGGGGGGGGFRGSCVVSRQVREHDAEEPP